MSAIVYACPHNGELLPCPTCGVPFPHRREELANWRKPSMCETHGTRLVPVLPVLRMGDPYAAPGPTLAQLFRLGMVA